MFASVSAHKRPILKAMESLSHFRSAAFTHRHPQLNDHKGQADVSRAFARIPDGSSALSGEHSVTLWGLLEESARLRSGWY